MSLIHDVWNLLVRFDHARGIDVLVNFAEHVAELGIELAHSEGVRIDVGVPAREFPILRRPT
jgi:hypothetical protein